MTGRHGLIQNHLLSICTILYVTGRSKVLRRWVGSIVSPLKYLDKLMGSNLSRIQTLAVSYKILYKYLAGGSSCEMVVE